MKRFSKSVTLTGLMSVFVLGIALMSCQNPTAGQLGDTGTAGTMEDARIVYPAAGSTVIGSRYPTTGSFSPYSMSTWGSGTWPQGARYTSGEGSYLEIGVYSKNATKMLLEIYSAATGVEAVYDYWMVKGADNIWRAKLTAVPGDVMYAFRAWGPNWPWSSSWTRSNSPAGFVTDVDSNGNRFNPNKVLFDPYGLEMTHDKETPALVAAGENGGMYGTGGTDVAAGQTYTGPITGNVAINRRNVNTGKWAPKSYAFVDATSTGTKPAIPQQNAIIYEGHVRGMTMHPSASSLATILSGFPGFSAVQNVPTQYRGTYKGLTYLIPYFKALGITTVELLPVHETANDINPDGGAGGNFWGYMTYSYFAPDRRYAYDKSPGGPTKEFKEMVKAFHDNGLEIYVDVVYNHTGEGGNWDATGKVAELTSFRGLDNAEYYALVSTNKALYWESTGCGNNFDSSAAIVKQHIKDSLIYYITKMGVDGFRFDLAPVLGRDNEPNYYFNPNAQLLVDIANMTTTYNVEMIAEAWDTQYPGGYQVGQFPSKWGEWNGRYRDAVRRFLKGDTQGGGGVTYADAFYGDYANFNDQGGPHKSVNFVIAHDGFTLADLVSYNTKTNTTRLWPFGPSDGGNDNNDSWGSDGNQSLRRQRIRNFYVYQMFSRGVPMIVYGDEFGRGQNGNNNPYNIDSVATWNNYNMINSDAPQAVSTGAAGEIYHNNLGTDSRADGKNNIFAFAAAVMNIRKNAPSLNQANYNAPIYFGKADGSAGFNATADRAVRIHIDGSAVGDTDYLLFVNMWTSQVSFTAPAVDSGKTWKRIIDTSTWAEANDNYWSDAAAWALSGAYGQNAWSISVFKAVGATVTPPATPTGLTATAASSSQINLGWTASSGATSYTVYRASTSGGTYSSIGTTSSTTYSNTGLAASTTYYYKVAASNSGGSSAQSGYVSATTQSNSTVTTTIKIVYDVGYGNNMYVRGSVSPLSWTLGKLMTWTTGNVWTYTTTAIPSGTAFEFKALINDNRWSDGANFQGTGGQTVTVYPTYNGNFYDTMDTISTNWLISGGTTTYKWKQTTGSAMAQATSTVSYLTQRYSMSKTGTEVTLAFKYKTVGLDTGEYLRVQVLKGTTWYTVATLGGTQDWKNVSYNITSYQSTAMKLRFLSYMNSTTEYVYVDNVTVSVR